MISVYSVRDGPMRRQPSFTASAAHVWLACRHKRDTKVHVGISARPDYWDAARSGGAFVVVDAPPLERSLSLCVRRTWMALCWSSVQARQRLGHGSRGAAAGGRREPHGLAAGVDAPVVAIDRLLRQAG
jgi:hypothetical protein